MSKYDSIINLEHYELKKHPRMSMDNRAAQFSPFAALNGYTESIKETARLTDSKIELSEDDKTELDLKLQLIEDNIKNRPKISVEYFISDNKKNGGKYIEYTGNIKRIDMVNNILIFDDKKISINDVVDIK